MVMRPGQMPKPEAPKPAMSASGQQPAPLATPPMGMSQPVAAPAAPQPAPAAPTMSHAPRR